MSHKIFLIWCNYLLLYKNREAQINFLIFCANELLRKKTIESNLINLKKLLMVGQTKIENYVDDNLTVFFFSFVSNKLIFILLVTILNF